MTFIFTSILEWILNGLSDLLIVLTAAFDMNFGFDIGNGIVGGSGSSQFDTVFYGAHNFAFVMTLLALILASLIFFFQIWKAFTGPLSDGEHPASLIFRLALTVILVMFCYQILYAIEIPFNVMYERFKSVGASIEFRHAAGLSEGGMFTAFAMEDLLKLIQTYVETAGSPVGSGAASAFRFVTAYEIGATAAGLLGIFTLLAIVWNYVKLLLEIIERYVILGVLFYTAPLPFSTLASKATNGIFSAWLKMVFSQVILMLLNVFFLQIFLRAMLALRPGNIFTFLVYAFMLVAWLMIGQRVDQYMSQLGLSTAQAGSSLAAAVVAGASVANFAQNAMRFGTNMSRLGRNLFGGAAAAKAGSSAAAAGKMPGAVPTPGAKAGPGMAVGQGNLTKAGQAFTPAAKKAINNANPIASSFAAAGVRKTGAEYTGDGRAVQDHINTNFPKMNAAPVGSALSVSPSGSRISTPAGGEVGIFTQRAFDAGMAPPNARAVTAADGSTYYVSATGQGEGLREARSLAASVNPPSFSPRTHDMDTVAGPEYSANNIAYTARTVDGHSYSYVSPTVGTSAYTGHYDPQTEAWATPLDQRDWSQPINAGSMNFTSSYLNQDGGFNDAPDDYGNRFLVPDPTGTSEIPVYSPVDVHQTPNGVHYGSMQDNEGNAYNVYDARDIDPDYINENHGRFEDEGVIRGVSGDGSGNFFVVDANSGINDEFLSEAREFSDATEFIVYADPETDDLQAGVQGKMQDIVKGK
jgi:hypothetical protein